MKTKSIYFRFIFFMQILLWLNHLAFAQSTEFGLGEYHGVYKESQFSGAEIKTNRGFSFALYPKRFLVEETSSRFGFRLTINRAEDDGAEPPSQRPIYIELGNNHRMTSLLLSYQRKLYQNDVTRLIAELAAGPTFFSSMPKNDFNHCDTFFCNFPEVRIIFAPGVTYMLKFYETIGLQPAAHYYLIPGGKNDIRRKAE